MEVKIGSGIRKQKFWNEGLYQNDECPVCSRLLQYPIYECELGHIICCDCVDCIECPVCNNNVHRSIMKNKGKKAKLDLADVESIIEQVKRIEDANTKKIKSQKIANPKLKQGKVRKQQSKKLTIEVLIQTDSESEKQIDKPLNFLHESFKNASDKTNAPKLKKMTPKNKDNYVGLTESLDVELGKGLKKFKDKKIENSSTKLIAIPKIEKQTQTLTDQPHKKFKGEKASVCKNKKPKGEKKSAEKKPKGEKDLENQILKMAIGKKLTPPLLVVVRSEETLTKSEEVVIVKKDIFEDTENPIHPSNAHQGIIEKSLIVNSMNTDEENNFEHELKGFVHNDDVYKYNEFLCSYLEPVLEPNMPISICKTLTECPILTEFLRSNGDFLSSEIVNVDTSLCCIPEENTNLVSEEPEHFDLNANYTDICLYEQLANVFEYITDTELINELNNTSQLLEECDYKFSESIENLVAKDLPKLQNSSCEISDVTDLTEIEIYDHDFASREDLSELISPASDTSKAKNGVPDELIVRNIMNELVEVTCEIIDLETIEVLEQSKLENSNGNYLPEIQPKISKHELDEKFEFAQGEQTCLKGEKRTECTDFEIYTDGFVEPFMELSKDVVTAKFVEDSMNFISPEEQSEALLETPLMILSDNFDESLSEKASDAETIKSIDKILNKLLKKVSENIEKNILDEILEKDSKKSLQDISENIGETTLVEIPEKDFKKSLKKVCENSKESSLVEIPEKDPNYVTQTSWDKNRDSVLNTLDQLINKVDETMQNQCMAVVEGDRDHNSQSWFTFTVHQIFDLFNEIKTLTSSCNLPKPIHINYDQTIMQKSAKPKLEHRLDIQQDLNENHRVPPVSQYWLEELLEMNTEFDKEDSFLPTRSNKISVNAVDKILKRGNQTWTHVSNNENFPGDKNLDIFVAEKIKLGNICRSQHPEFTSLCSGTFQDEYFIPATPLIIPYCSVTSTPKGELRNSFHLFPCILANGIPEESKPVATSFSVATGMDDEQEVACQVGTSLISLNEEQHDHSGGVFNMNLQASSPMKLSTIDDTGIANNYIADLTHSCVDEMMETVLYSIQNACIAAKKGVNAVISAHQDVELDSDLSTSTCISFVDPEIDPGVMEIEEMYFDALESDSNSENM